MSKILLSGLIAWIVILNSSFAQEVKTPQEIKTTQEVKTTTAVRTEHPPKIDGILDDEVWRNVPIATDFIEQRPTPGKHEKNENRTEIKIIYDNNAIYVAAHMYDEKPDSIARELTTRDRIANSDFLGIIFDTYYDKINALGFYVTTAGTQFDAKYSGSGNEDENWNAVWESGTKIDKTGWTAEFKIPYSAIRFGNNEKQTWGFNMTRKRQRNNQQLFWNSVDPKVSGFVNQEGVINGIENIKAPVRLSFSPYMSSYVNNYPQATAKNFSNSFNGGMDVKYGINQSFTLDMTLVPDFGQVQSDNQVLNLSPFELRFNENRTFFTEGTELFGKGDLFYSRRIGSFPTYKKDIGDLPSTETIISNPSESKLINATKISGRTTSGLGIGVFNGITNRANAIIRDASGITRVFETQPLTNYNIVVVDQSLKNNSSATILNTNVLRQGSAYDANVSAFLFSLNNKGNKYNLSGNFKVSQLSEGAGNDNASTGMNYDMSVSKQSGAFTWHLNQTLTDDKFDPTDLGFATNNNFLNNSVWGSYRIYKPGKWYNTISDFYNFKYSQRFLPRSFQYFEIYNGGNIVFKNFLQIGFDATWTSKGNDFYEARKDNRAYNKPSNLNYGVFFNTNRSKRYNGGGNVYFNTVGLFNGRSINYGAYQNYRVNNHLSLTSEIWINRADDYAGWVGENTAEEIIFSKYDRNTVDNSIYAKYTFNNKMGINLRARHYWSDRRNSAFYSLTNPGDLISYSGHDFDDKNQNYNVFNIDMSYFWQFAPGSEFIATYKNASTLDDNIIRRGYGNNFRDLMESPQNNNISIKVSYYIDYLKLRKK
ncbi:MAG TPA: hypothetical protein DIT07_04375 [Sphingobacteriaceae bacterium]|nr:hypothetical protein [Sphingobacteriaceae bacterium]